MQGVATVGWRTFRRLGALLAALTLAAQLPAFAQFERGTDLGTIKDAQGGVDAWRHRDGHEYSRSSRAARRHDRDSRLFTFPNLSRAATT